MMTLTVWMRLVPPRTFGLTLIIEVCSPVECMVKTITNDQVAVMGSKGMLLKY